MITVTSKDDFIQKLFDAYYPSEAHTPKIMIISDKLEGRNVDWTLLFNEVIKYTYHPCPQWADIHGWLERFEKQIDSKMLPEPPRKKNGIWKCARCRGKGGHMEVKIKGSMPYNYFVPCVDCNGVGVNYEKVKWNMNYLDEIVEMPLEAMRKQIDKEPKEFKNMAYALYGLIQEKENARTGTRKPRE